MCVACSWKFMGTPCSKILAEVWTLQSSEQGSAPASITWSTRDDSKNNPLKCRLTWTSDFICLSELWRDRRSRSSGVLLLCWGTMNTWELLVCEYISEAMPLSVDRLPYGREQSVQNHKWWLIIHRGARSAAVCHQSRLGVVFLQLSSAQHVVKSLKACACDLLGREPVRTSFPFTNFSKCVLIRLGLFSHLYSPTILRLGSLRAF